MKIVLESMQEVTPTKLAKALANADPEDFADFWFQFAGMVDNKRLEDFAKAMAPQQGGKRKEPFKKLATLLAYHEIKEAE